MSLEDKIEKLTAAVVELTAVVTANSASAPAPAKAAAVEKPAAKAGKANDKPAAKAGGKAAKTYDYEKHIKPKLIELGNTEGMGQEAIASLLSEFEVARAPDLDPKAYPKVLSRIDEILAGTGETDEEEEVEEEEDLL